MNRFPSQYERYEDTRGAGGITVEGVELICDDKNCVEAPVRLEDTLASHGFYRINSALHVAWVKSKPKPAMNVPVLPTQKQDANVSVKGTSASGRTGKV